MPIGELIGAAIGIMLLIIVAYVVVGSVLFSSEITISAQKDVVLHNEIRENTLLAIEIPSLMGVKSFDKTTGQVNFIIKNTGNEIISDFTHMDIVAQADCNSAPILYNYNTNGWQISNAVTGTTSPTGIYIDDHPNMPEQIHHGMLDPGESMGVSFTVSCDPGNSAPLSAVHMWVISGNGVVVPEIFTAS